MFAGLPGLLFSKRVDDEHWWDSDPIVLERNRQFEAELEQTLRLPHQSNGGGPHVTLKAWAQVIGMIGIPGVMALWLVYVGSTEVPQIRRQQEQIITEQRALRERQEQVIQLMNRLIYVTQQACYNAGRDDNARQRCFDRQ